VSPLQIIKGARVFAPRDLGVSDVLIAGDRIAAVGGDGAHATGAEVIDGSRRYVVPGFIDNHVHVLGGGGEAGAWSRGERLHASRLLACGLTCVVGLLGADGVSRRLEDLYAHTLALRDGGMAAYMLTGSYDVPPPTLTGSVQRDMFLVEPVIGLGEIAVGDHRSSFPSGREIGRLASAVASGGRVVGKRGYVNFHVGDVPGCLAMLADVLKTSGLPADRFLPTHVQRSTRLVAEAIEFARAGGNVDLTTAITPEEGFPDSVRIADAVTALMDGGVPAGRITISSDGGGMTVIRDAQGHVVENRQCLPSGMLRDFRTMAGGPLGVATAAAFFTCNVAEAIGLAHRRGRIAPGMAADLLLLGSDLALHGVIAGGVWWDTDEGRGAACRRAR
jgi:beta-aspartyl-dipeptidase (metallo-type)